MVISNKSIPSPPPLPVKISDLLTLDFNNCSPSQYSSPPPSNKEFRAVPCVALDFNICHVFDRFEKSCKLQACSYSNRSPGSVTVYTIIFDFIKTNHQLHIEMLIKLQYVHIKLFALSGELSFNFKCILASQGIINRPIHSEMIHPRHMACP